MGQRRQRFLEAPDGFPVDRAGEGLGTGLLEVGDRLRPVLAQKRMVGQPVDVLGQPVRIGPLDGLHDSDVEGAPPVLEQAAVGHFVGQRVLEGVLDIREDPGLVQELRGLEASDRGVQLVLGELGNRLQQAKRHVLPDHRRRLQERLVRGGEPVDAGGDHGLDRRRDLDGRQGPRQLVGAALTGEGSRLDECPHALFQEEWVTLGPRDEHARERLEAGVGSQQRREEPFGAFGWQGIQPELRVVRTAPPGMLILRPVVHEQQESGGREALDQLIEQGLGLGVDPVEVLDDDQQRLDLAFPEQEPLHRVQRASAALGRIERRPLQVIGRHVEERQQRG